MWIRCIRYKVMTKIIKLFADIVGVRKFWKEPFINFKEGYQWLVSDWAVLRLEWIQKV